MTAEGERLFMVVIVLVMMVLLICMARSCAHADPAFGCFVDRRWPEIQHLGWTRLCEDMRDIGMNSTALYVYGPEPDKDLAEQMDIATCVGLLHKEVPVFVLFNYTRPTDSQVCPVEIIADAKKVGTLVERWPEMVVYGADEAQQVTAGDPAFTELVHQAGLRLGAGCVYPFVVPRIPFLDVVLVAIIEGGGLERDKRVIEAYPREYGNYLVIGTVKTRDGYDMMRYYTGIWSWQTGGKWALVWDYRRLFGLDERWPGDSLARGFRDGVRDYGRLREPCWDFQPEVR